MFEYNICNQYDSEIFKKQCRALEEHIPDLIKSNFLKDVDGSEIQFYYKNENKITVHNSLYINAVYVNSEIDLSVYF